MARLTERCWGTGPRIRVPFQPGADARRDSENGRVGGTGKALASVLTRVQLRPLSAAGGLAGLAWRPGRELLIPRIPRGAKRRNP